VLEQDLPVVSADQIIVLAPARLVLAVVVRADILRLVVLEVLSQAHHQQLLAQLEQLPQLVVLVVVLAVRLQQQIQEHKVEEEVEHHHLVLLQLLQLLV
jgi:hypothetical protein